MPRRQSNQSNGSGFVTEFAARLSQSRSTSSMDGSNATTNAPPVPPRILKSCKKMAVALQRAAAGNKIRLSDMYHTFDSSRQGRVTLDQFAAGAYALDAPLSEHDVADLFNHIDSGNKGFLTLKDFAEIVRPFRKRRDPFARQSMEPQASTSASPTQQ